MQTPDFWIFHRNVAEAAKGRKGEEREGAVVSSADLRLFAIPSSSSRSFATFASLP